MALRRPVAAVGGAEGLVVYGKPSYARTRRRRVARRRRRWLCLLGIVRDLGDLPAQPGWKRLDPDPRVAAWTDDYADVLGAILDRKLRR